MPFFKDAEIKDAREIYGFENKGVFTNEFIKKGEPIFTCDISICDYLLIENTSNGHTRDETIEYMNKYPESRDFIHHYMYMVEDDLFDWPRNWAERKVSEGCMYFNHSCDPNCGFQALDSSLVVAIRDIQPGEELTYDYQCMDTEPSFYDGIKCCCRSFKCRGILRFDQYRNVDWQNQFYKYSGQFVKNKIDELKTKWFSSRCYPKHLPIQSQESSGRELGLAALRKIRKDDLVAIYSDPSNINREAHYLRHSENPTCYLEGNEVFALTDVEPETELTLNFNSK
jgi:SET domain-containing protein